MHHAARTVPDGLFRFGPQELEQLKTALDQEFGEVPLPFKTLFMNSVNTIANVSS